MLKHCNEKGQLRIDNMTKYERRGYRKLMKRTAANEIIISQTDKSAKNTVSTNESYLQQGYVHVQGDTVVSWSQYKRGRKLALAHTKTLSQVFQVGKEHGEEAAARAKKALHEESRIVPNLIITQKDISRQILTLAYPRLGRCVKLPPHTTKGSVICYRTLWLPRLMKKTAQKQSPRKT